MRAYVYNTLGLDTLTDYPTNTVRGREASCESARAFIPSVTSEDSETMCKSPSKSCTSLTGALQVMETDSKEMKLNLGKGLHRTMYDQIDDIRMPSQDYTSTSSQGSHVKEKSRFNLLYKNLEKIEEIFFDEDLVTLEKDILMQLGKIGALQLFHVCLSRTLQTSITTNYSTQLTNNPREAEIDNQVGDVIVRSTKKEERKSRRERSLEKPGKTSAVMPSSKTISNYPRRATGSTVGNLSKSRIRRHNVARNEAEMSIRVKDVAELEKIRTKLEAESGQVASFRRWAEAAGIAEKVLQQRLHYGWFCRDRLLRSTHSLIVYLARNYRGLGISLEDLYQVTLSRRINKIKKARRTLYNVHGRYPDEDEIARFCGLSLAKLRLANQCPSIVGSVDQRIGDNFSPKYMEFTPDTSIETPEEFILRQRMKKDLYELLQGLHSRESQVLVLRYGLWDGQCRSLQEIANIFKCTKEWIRKIEQSALTKLRDEDVNKGLSQYLNLQL
ncbi:hypothetical protein AQUCO_00100199v1 [Aquilegia coerulea]|uniref:RNA polymerase sigma-70 domain-containing protein n=1 Tax=Aquilegia coerulea TaxID=218851 RepID=A0A2G5F9E9_AQUCA|nr:hypothetical protein AQUCO_00100199v1 [Aquilegia coerulea]